MFFLANTTTARFKSSVDILNSIQRFIVQDRVYDHSSLFYPTKLNDQDFLNLT